MFLEYIKKYEKNSILISIIMILISILLIINPTGVLNVVMIIFGLAILIDGILRFISYFKSEKESRVFSVELFMGIVEIMAGILVLIGKGIFISILPILIGIWIIVRSIMKLQISFNLKSADSERWILILISSIVSLLLGVLIILNPFGTVVTITVIAGIILLISSIIDLCQSLAIIKVLK